MRTPESYSFGSVLKKALDSGSAINKGKKTTTQKEVNRLLRMRSQIIDTVEEYIRHFQQDSIAEAVEEARFAAKDLTAAAKRLGKLPLDMADPCDALQKCSDVVMMLVETIESIVDTAKTATELKDQQGWDQALDYMHRIVGVFDVAYNALDEAVQQAEAEFGR